MNTEMIATRAAVMVTRADMAATRVLWDTSLAETSGATRATGETTRETRAIGAVTREARVTGVATRVVGKTRADKETGADMEIKTAVGMKVNTDNRA